MSTSRTMAWVAWIVASVFYAYQYILRVMPNIMLTDIMQQFQIDTKTFGQFSGVYYLGYCLMHLPIGVMLDRFGPRKVMPLCILMTVVGLLPIIFSNYWVYLILGRALIGMGSSAAILSAFKIIRITFNEERFTRMLSLSVTIGLLGAIYGGGPLHYMCANLGYKSVVIIFAITGVVLSFVTYLLVPEIEGSHSPSVLNDIKGVFQNGKVLSVCFFSGLMVGPIEGLADVWGTQFLKQVYGLESTTASSLPSLIFMGMCFGAPFLSLIAEKTKSYIGTIIASAIIMASSFMLIINVKLTTPVLSGVFVLIGVCCAYQIIAIYKASTYVKEDVAGLTTAIANMVIMTFGYFFHSMIGLLINASGGVHSSDAIIHGLTIIPIGLSISSIGFIGMAFYEKSKIRGQSSRVTV